MEKIMKPFERFLEQMKEGARLAQTNDPASATEVIQEALRSAGLLTGQVPAATDGATPGMVDLNGMPDWTQFARAPGGAAPDMIDLNGMPDWAQLARGPGGDRPAGAPRSRKSPLRPRTKTYAPDPRAPGEFVEGSFSAAAGTRRYKLYIPSRPSVEPRPLIVMLHGCKQNPDDFAAGTAMNVLAEEHGCLVLYPEQAMGNNASSCWNWFEAAHQARDAGEPSLLAGMTREIIETRHADPKRVYVAGLSAGGAMAAIMGQAYPELYAAVGVHSGLPAGSARDLITGLAAMKKAPAKRGKHGRTLRQRTPLIVFHGDRDAIVHPGNGDAVLHQFLHDAPGSPAEGLERKHERSGNGDGRDYTKTSMLDADGRTVAEYWEVHGAGHAWFGGSAAGSYTDPAGPSASAEMLRFFLAQGQ
jgi:poly(hydroxyalkanoate) depolymerase family esterase